MYKITLFLEIALKTASTAVNFDHVIMFDLNLTHRTVHTTDCLLSDFFKVLTTKSNRKFIHVSFTNGYFINV